MNEEKAKKILEETLKTTPNLFIYKEGCPFCTRAKMTLKNNKVLLVEKDQEYEPELTSAAKLVTKHKTFPMVWVNGVFIGGNDDVTQHYNKKKDSKAKNL